MITQTTNHFRQAEHMLADAERATDVVVERNLTERARVHAELAYLQAAAAGAEPPITKPEENVILDARHADRKQVEFDLLKSVRVPYSTIAEVLGALRDQGYFIGEAVSE